MDSRNANAAAMSAFRVIFSLAAVYNVAFGLWAGLFPLAFFDFFRLPPPLYPSIWACLGMVVGLYGPLYAYVAWRPERGDVIVLIGLAGKILGPCGWLVTVYSDGELPPRTFPLILGNDLVWWFPFAFYLLRHSTWRRAAAAAFAVGIHLAACLGLLIVSPATEMEPDMAARAAWAAHHTGWWVAAWILWAVSSMSLLAFCTVWVARLAELDGWRRLRSWAVAGWLLIAVGLLFDLAGETVLIALATWPGIEPEEFARYVRCYNLLGPAAANGLYCLGGLALSAVSWRIGWLRGPVGALGMSMWLTGLGLTAAALVDHRQAMVVLGAMVMLLFLPWAALVAWMHFKQAAQPPR